jgi:hypothetical protein
MESIPGLAVHPSDSAPTDSLPLTPPPRFHPSDSAPSASTPPTRPLWGGGIAPSGSFRYSGMALSELANLKLLRSSASGRKKKGSILAKAHPQKK